MEKRRVGYIMYYLLVFIIACLDAVNNWNLRVLIILILLIILYVSIGGEENHIIKLKEYWRNPMLSQDLPQDENRDMSSLPFVPVVLVILPLVLYLLADIFFFKQR